MQNKPFPKLVNDRIIKVAKGETPDKLPVWVMRQAGRYLPEYQELRKNNSFFDICQNPELACEATLIPIRRFKVDAAIIFSDILVVPQALGMKVKMVPGVGPVFPDPLTLESMTQLNLDGAISRLQYVGDAISLTRHRLNGAVPLFGFSGAPWTVMCYMIEGGGSKTMSKAKKWLYCHPDAATQLMDLLAEVITDYLLMQIKSGAQIVQVFDSCVEHLDRELYSKYGLPQLKRIASNLKQQMEASKIAVFIKGAHICVDELDSLGYDVVGIDWTISPSRVGARVGDRDVTIQGNLDPCALYAPKEKLIEMVERMIAGFGTHFGTRRLIVNLGHGVYPDTDPEAFKTFVDAVHAVRL
ncbi:unnamed protein product [Acanthoscelides obtectus]|uniref:Uroporphyrinogen decarboxylase n=1 Tax=Acanthoscelides obtectus TaxID=200917 RepID=A0A9P0M610_ACAOB|nr:unnamed protein product [Acanthoscelides obtectus]CAK1629194.1 Uroporphyrinogen decarboxylase [Acanthoscelides obtectus]